MTSDAVVSLQRLLTNVDGQAVVMALMILLGYSEDRVSVSINSLMSASVTQ